MNKCKCGHKIESAPGIGDYCTNRDCSEAKKLWEQWEKQKMKRLELFVAKLQAKMHYHQYPYASEGMRKLLEYEIQLYIAKTRIM